jgi:hypothetical protein
VTKTRTLRTRTSRLPGDDPYSQRRNAGNKYHFGSNASTTSTADNSGPGNVAKLAATTTLNGPINVRKLGPTRPDNHRPSNVSKRATDKHRPGNVSKRAPLASKERMANRDTRAACAQPLKTQRTKENGTSRHQQAISKCLGTFRSGRQRKRTTHRSLQPGVTRREPWRHISRTTALPHNLHQGEHTDRSTVPSYWLAVEQQGKERDLTKPPARGVAPNAQAGARPQHTQMQCRITRSMQSGPTSPKASPHRTPYTLPSEAHAQAGTSHAALPSRNHMHTSVLRPGRAARGPRRWRWPRGARVAQARARV